VLNFKLRTFCALHKRDCRRHGSRRAVDNRGIAERLEEVVEHCLRRARADESGEAEVGGARLLEDELSIGVEK
jgi:hypothetical protein